MADSTMHDRLDAAGVAAAVACCALWGGNAVAVKYAIPSLPAFGCAAIRFAISLPLLAVVCRASGQALGVKRPLWGLLLVHGAFSAVQIGTFNWGVSHSEAGRSSVFINVHPLVVAPLAWLTLGERLGVRGVGGLAAAVAGVATLLAEPLRRGGGLAGDMVVLLSGIVFGVQTVVQKKTFPLIPPTTLLFAQTIVAAVLAGAISAVAEGPEAFHPTREALWGVLYQGVAVSGVCFAVWLLLLRRYPAGRLATVAFLTPLFGVGLGHAMRGEALTLALVAGGGLVGLGIYLVASDRSAQRRPPDLALPGEDAP